MSLFPCDVRDDQPVSEQVTVEAYVESLRTAVQQLRACHTASEAAFADAIHELMTQLKPPAVREHRLGDLGVIDGYVPALRIGIELKVKGVSADVSRQLHRYAGSADIDHLVLVTAYAKLRTQPGSMKGKPLTVISLGMGAFL